MRADIESKFLDFMRHRAIGGDIRSAAKSGHFSALPQRSEPDLFGSLDMLYSAHILGMLDDITTPSSRRTWVDHLLTYQGDDGWFRSNDTQSHGVEHATAYALGGLQILINGDGAALDGRIKHLRGLRSEIAQAPSRTHAPFTLSLMQRVHFWRGSHRAAGLAAIVGAAHDLGLPCDQFLGIANPRAWLSGWWAYFAARIDPATGYWALAPGLLRVAFDTLYQFRHQPQLASMGGAVHLYWISEKMAAPMPYPAALIPTTTKLMQPSGLYEHRPYCIDLDANFLIARALVHFDPDGGTQATARHALGTNRDAVLAWYSSRKPRDWGLNSHSVPGAFAAVAEADRVLLSADERRWRDIFETVWWL